MPRFGDLEAAIMDAVWERAAPVSVRDVLHMLRRDPEPAYTTVQTVMDNLFNKQWLTRDKHGRTNIYAARFTREDYVSGLMSEALAATPDRTAALVRFFEDMDPADNAELRRALEHAKSSAADPLPTPKRRSAR